MPDSNNNNPGHLQTASEARRWINKARSTRTDYTPSPSDWRKEILYFLLPDRFSDGQEATRPLLTRDEINAMRSADSLPTISWEHWSESGRRWQGGTINGIASKLDYLAELGITAI